MNVQTTATDGTELSGVFRRPDATPVGAALLLHPHPGSGGNMDVWLLPAIATTLAVAGWATLRINFRGVGDSGGIQSNGEFEDRDARGALRWMTERVPDVPTAVVGWSFGAMIGLRLGTGVDHWVGIAPPTRRVPGVRLSGPIMPDVAPPHRTIIVGSHDQFFPPSTVGVLAPHTVIEIGDADHFLFDRDPEVAAHVLSALSADPREATHG